MQRLLKFLTFALPLSAVLLACSPVAQSQTARGRLFDRSARDASTSIPAGVKQATITVDGKRREFLYYVPASRSARPALFLGLHGGRGDGAKFLSQTPSMISLADRKGFIAVYPSADGNWNDGRSNFAGNPSDVTFIRALVDWFATNFNADRSRVFVTGISNGGVMAQKLACDASDLIAGIAPIAGDFNKTLYGQCRPSGPVPVVMFNGTDDPLMVYNGGQPTSRLAKFAPGGDGVVSAEDTLRFWAKVDGCSSSPTLTNLPDRYDDGTTVTLIQYSCPRAKAMMYRINGGGHAVPGSAPPGPMQVRLVGRTTQEINAMAKAVEFFQRYGL